MPANPLIPNPRRPLGGSQLFFCQAMNCGQEALDPDTIVHTEDCAWVKQEMDAAKIHEELGTGNRKVRFLNANPRAFFKAVEPTPTYSVAKNFESANYTVIRHESHGLSETALAKLDNGQHALRMMHYLLANDVSVRFCLQRMNRGENDAFISFIGKAFEETKNK